LSRFTIRILATLLAAGAAASSATDVSPPAFSPSLLDTTCAPCQDFYRFANGVTLRLATDLRVEYPSGCGRSGKGNLDLGSANLTQNLHQALGRREIYGDFFQLSRQRDQGVVSDFSQPSAVEIAHALGYVVGGMDDIVGTESFCRIEAVLHHIGSDDPARSQGPGQIYLQKPGHSAADDKHALSRLEAHDALRAEDARERFDECAFFIGYFVGKRKDTAVDVQRGHAYILGEASGKIVRGVQCLAGGVVAGQAVMASIAGYVV